MLLVQRQIASIIDHPSVFMGGPSRNSMNKADRVIVALENSFRITGSRCGHGAWLDYRTHGTHCPTCGMQVVDGKPE